MNENVIEISGLSKRYSARDPADNWKTSLAYLSGRKEKSKIPALTDISLDIKRGEVLGIVGPNGAGKTTLLKVIAGLLIPEEGKVTVNGYDIIHHRHDVRTSCNFLRSGGWIIFDYKYPIYKNLEFWAVIAGMPFREARFRVDEALEAVDLLDKKKDYPENLSAGMRQKLNVARVLLSPRPICLLDEPTVNIDPYTSNFIRNFIKNEFTKDGTTAILATHNLWEAEMMCDRIAVLFQGKMVMIGTSEEIKSKAGHQNMVLKYRGLTPSLVKDIEALDFVTSVETRDDTMRIVGGRLKENFSKIAEMFEDIRRVEYMDISEQSFNDAFMELIKEQHQSNG